MAIQMASTDLFDGQLDKAVIDEDAGARPYIPGQVLRYRNTPPAWTNMVHPSPAGASGVRITAVTFDGRTVELFNEAGQFGLKRMIDAAARKRKEGGVFELRWANGNVSVAVDLKITSSGSTNGNGESTPGRGFHGMRLPESIVGRTMQASAPAVAAVSAGAVQ